MGEWGFSLGLPTGWHEVPAAGAGEARTALAATGPASTGDAEADAVLARAHRFASAQGRPARRHFVYLGGSQPVRARAWAFLELLPRGGVSIAEFATAAAATPAAGASSPAADSPSAGPRFYRRETEQVELAGLPCVVVHDVVEPGGASARALQQRLVATIFPDDPAIVVRFELSSPDLLVFDDFVRSGVEFANTLRLHEEAPA
ncbi:hypothetical protein [Herbiconiux sp. A18JL235]|uniref:Uncharacterized protein n=1 Tax=Herbiconiux sp. A18JL235 TaxID=3152363 RepID=A0AB39BJK7_9MICO